MLIRFQQLTAQCIKQSYRQRITDGTHYLMENPSIPLDTPSSHHPDAKSSPQHHKLPRTPLRVWVKQDLTLNYESGCRRRISRAAHARQPPAPGGVGRARCPRGQHLCPDSTAWQRRERKDLTRVREGDNRAPQGKGSCSSTQDFSPVQFHTPGISLGTSLCSSLSTAVLGISRWESGASPPISASPSSRLPGIPAALTHPWKANGAVAKGPCQADTSGLSTL